MTESKLEYGQLEVGQEFPVVSFTLDSESVVSYLKATGEADSIYDGTGIVPPTAITAWALISLLEYIDLPDGTIHLSQEIQSNGISKEGQTLVCRAMISRKQERGQLKLFDITYDVLDNEEFQLISGKSSFNFP